MIDAHQRRKSRWGMVGAAVLAVIGLAATPAGPANATVAVPGNDLFANAQVISGASGTVSGTTLKATDDAPLGAVGASHSVWYSWTAPATGTFVFDTCGSSINTVLAIFRRDPPNTTKLFPVSGSPNDDGCPPLQSRIEFSVTSGSVYMIEAYGADTSMGTASRSARGPGTTNGVEEWGPFTLNWRFLGGEVFVTKNVVGTPPNGAQFTVRFTCHDQTTPVLDFDVQFGPSGGVTSGPVGGNPVCVVSEPNNGGASSVVITCVAEDPANGSYAECTDNTHFYLYSDDLQRDRLYGAIRITVTNTFRGNQPPPPPPPPPPAEICNKASVTVDLARGQTPTNGSDVIRGTTGDDIINALDGNDIICSLAGDDIVSGNQGNDRVFGGGGDDEMRGNSGDDILRARAGDDTLYGQAGNDTLDGGTDTDTCRGGTDTDTANACETTAGVP